MLEGLSAEFAGVPYGPLKSKRENPLSNKKSPGFLTYLSENRGIAASAARWPAMMEFFASLQQGRPGWGVLALITGPYLASWGALCLRALVRPSG